MNDAGAIMSTPQLVIWDFDGVLCDSLYECMTVTRVAAWRLENPAKPVTAANLHEICEPGIVATMHAQMRPLRPFIVKGQDYLWQYFNLKRFSPVPEGFDQYSKVFAGISSPERDREYEQLYYDSRKLVQALMGQQYFTLFRAYPGALYAFRSSLRRKRTWICTARDQQGVLLLFGNHGLEFSASRIYAKDWNGEVANPGLGKSEQILQILDREGGRDQEFILIEDQVKAPAELQVYCPRMHVMHACYGYGLEQDWAAAALLRQQQAKTPEALLYGIY